MKNIKITKIRIIEVFGYDSHEKSMKELLMTFFYHSLPFFMLTFI